MAGVTRRPTPRGEILREEFLKPFATTSEVWLNAQTAIDLYATHRRPARP
jgi:plasmid maintenance system antidote protein VapI